MDEPIKEADKNAVSLVHTNSHCRGGMVVHAKEISMIASIFLSLSHCALGIFGTGKRVNRSDEYGLEIPANLQSLHFYRTEKVIKLAKKVK